MCRALADQKTKSPNRTVTGFTLSSKVKKGPPAIFAFLINEGRAPGMLRQYLQVKATSDYSTDASEGNRACIRSIRPRAEVTYDVRRMLLQKISYK